AQGARGAYRRLIRMQERDTLLAVTQVLLQGESGLDLECSGYIVQEQGNHLLTGDAIEKSWRSLLLWLSHGCPPPSPSCVRCIMRRAQAIASILFFRHACNSIGLGA